MHEQLAEQVWLPLGGALLKAISDFFFKVFNSFDTDHNKWAYFSFFNNVLSSHLPTTSYMDVQEYLALMGVTHGGNLQQKLNGSIHQFVFFIN